MLQYLVFVSVLLVIFIVLYYCVHIIKEKRDNKTATQYKRKYFLQSNSSVLLGFIVPYVGILSFWTNQELSLGDYVEENEFINKAFKNLDNFKLGMHNIIGKVLVSADINEKVK